MCLELWVFLKDDLGAQFSPSYEAAGGVTTRLYTQTQLRTFLDSRPQKREWYLPEASCYCPQVLFFVVVVVCLFVCFFIYLFIYYYYHYYYYFIDFARYHFSSVQSLDQWNSRLGEGWHDEGRFSRQPLPVFSWGGQLEQFWYRQGRLFFWTFVLISALISFMLLVTVLHFPVLTFFFFFAIRPCSDSEHEKSLLSSYQHHMLLSRIGCCRFQVVNFTGTMSWNGPKQTLTTDSTKLDML